MLQRMQRLASYDYIINYYYIQLRGIEEEEKKRCDYIINYYYIQLFLELHYSNLRCDYIINYYYIQHSAISTVYFAVVITL